MLGTGTPYGFQVGFVIHILVEFVLDGRKSLDDHIGQGVFQNTITFPA